MLHPTTIDLPDSALVALVEGRIEEAIRAVRDAEDLGFHEAKRIIERHIMCNPALREQWVARRDKAQARIRRVVRGTLLLLAVAIAWLLARA